MKHMIKMLIYYIVYILVLPLGLSAKIFHKAFGSTTMFHFWAELLSLAPAKPGILIRSCYYNQTLAKCHYSLLVMFGTQLSKMDSKIGKFCCVGGHSTVGLVEMEDYAIIANHVSLLSGSKMHNFSDSSKGIFDGEDHFVRIHLGKNSFIGDNSTVMASVGDRSIVAAGSVVIKDVEANVVVGGNPAKVLKRRDKAEESES